MHDQRLFGPLWVPGTGRWGMGIFMGIPLMRYKQCCIRIQAYALGILLE